MQLTTRESLKSTLFSMSKHSKGIRIKESVISLNEEERLKVCRHLSWYFDKERVNLKNHFQFMSNENGGGMPARRLAVEIAVALEPHIQLSKPEIQRNINATKAIYLGGLSPEMSSVQKQELGSEMVKETDNGLEIAAIRLAETLVRKYHVELSEEAIDFLKYNYGANRQALKRIANNKVEQNTSYEAEIAIPPMPEETKKEWQYGLSQINKRISKL